MSILGFCGELANPLLTWSGQTKITPRIVPDVAYSLYDIPLECLDGLLGLAVSLPINRLKPARKGAER